MGGTVDHVLKLFPDLNVQPIVKQKNEKMLTLLRKRNNHCVYIYGGGGLFPDDNYKHYLQIALQFFVIKYLKRGKSIIYGVDLCDIRDARSKVIWNVVSHLCEAISVRNKFSKELLNKTCGVGNVMAYSDVTFGLTTLYERDENKLEGIESELGINRTCDKYIIWILAMPWGDDELSTKHFHDRYERLVNQYVELANRYSQYGYHHVFIPFFHDRDRIIIDDVTKSIVGRFTIVGENDVPMEAKRALFKHASAVISMRFHGVAFAIRHAIPVVALSYAQKTSELMNECNLSRYCLEYGIRDSSTFFKEFDFDTDKLIKTVDSVIFNDNNLDFKNAQKLMVSLAEERDDVIRRLFDIK